MRGRFVQPPVLTEFDNVTSFDQLIVIGPMSRSPVHTISCQFTERHTLVCCHLTTTRSLGYPSTTVLSTISARGFRSRKNLSSKLASS